MEGEERYDTMDELNWHSMPLMVNTEGKKLSAVAVEEKVSVMEMVIPISISASPFWRPSQLHPDRRPNEGMRRST